MWKGEAGSLNETLVNQLENQNDSTSLITRGRFLVVATDNSNGPEHLLSTHIYSVLWQVDRIVNVVVFLTN